MTAGKSEPHVAPEEAGRPAPLDASPPDASPPDASPPDASPLWEQRILQVEGRRYSLRLEPSFWEVLAALAAERRMRINHLVAAISRQCPPNGNLSSAVRAFCLRETQRALLDKSTATDRTSLLTIVRSAPSPCLVVAGDKKILAVNEPFSAWVGMPVARLAGQPVLRHFRFRGERSFDEVWASLGMATTSDVVKSRIINISVGRVLVANALLVPVMLGRSRPMCLIWVTK